MMTKNQFRRLLEADSQLRALTNELYDSNDQEARRLCRYIWCASSLLMEIIEDELKKIKNGEQSL